MSHVQFDVALADDEPSIRRGVRLMLEEMGGRVTEAADGTELRTLLLQRTFDVIVTDLRMPRWNGLDVLLEARARGNTTPAVLMSGDLNEVRDLVAPGDAILLLEKPFVSAALKRLVVASLRRSAIDRDQYGGERRPESGPAGPPPVVADVHSRL